MTVDWRPTQPRLPRLRAFIVLSRPHFLLGGALLFAVGAASADRLDPIAYLGGQLMVTAIQLTAHYANEFADIEADRFVENRTFFSGGSGVLVAGRLSPNTALRSARVSTGVALVAAAVLSRLDLTLAGLGLLAIFVSWAYSVPPLRLLGTGFGEVVTSLVVGAVLPIVGALTQREPIGAGLWWAIGVLVPAHVGMMIAFELPDRATDELAGKRVLAVRLGSKPAALAMVGLWSLAVAGLMANPEPEVSAIGALLVGLLAVVATVASLVKRHGTATAAAVAVLSGCGLTLLLGGVGGS